MDERNRTIEEVRAIRRRGDENLSRHWAALHAGSIITTPIAYLKIISDYMQFQPGEKLIDIGSGHGDPALVFAALNPQMEITGYDIVKAKVDGAAASAKKLGITNASFVEQDLSEPGFQLPFADYFYLFNPVNEEVVRSLALQIMNLSSGRRVKVIIFGIGWDASVFEESGFQVTSDRDLQDSAGTRVFEYKKQVGPPSPS